MLLYVIFAVLKLAAAQFYPALHDYALLGSSMPKYHHPPAPFFYKPTPISENAYGYYPPSWPAAQPQPLPLKRASKPDKEDDDDTWDVRAHSRFCKLFEGSGKPRSGQLPTDEYTELLMRRSKKNEEEKRRNDEVIIAPRMFVITNQTSPEAPKANPKVDKPHKATM